MLTSNILLENYNLSILIIMLIPFSFLGHFLTFSLGEFYFDQGGYAAFVLLAGITVNSAVYVMFDFRNRRKRSKRALIQALVDKREAILLTVFSTCLGMIPFIIIGESEIFWFALGVGSIGGLIFSLIGVFIILPMLATAKET